MNTKGNGTMEEAVKENEAASGVETSVEIEAAEKLGGKVEIAMDEMAIEKATGKESQVEESVVPSFFVDENEKVRMEFDVLCDKNTKKISLVARTGMGLDFTQLQYFGHTVEWFEFSVPTYEDLSTYRQRSSVYRRDAGKVLVDAIQLRNFFLVWHLKDWSLRKANGEKVVLGFTPEGALDEDSIKLVYQMPPTMIDVILTSFEKEIIST